MNSFCRTQLAAALLALIPQVAATQTIIPDQWSGGVIEGGMGQSTAFYVTYDEDAFGVVLHCFGPGRYLSSSVTSRTEAAQFPDGGTVNPRFLLIDGRYYPLPVIGDEEYLRDPFPGQQEILQALYAGSEAVAVVAPNGDLSKAVEFGRIPGNVAPPGLAHVASDCGGLPKVRGPLETIDPTVPEPTSGNWFLRPRSEIIAAPVSVNIYDGGGSIALFCDGAGNPAAYIFGILGPADPYAATSPVTIWVDDTAFTFQSARYQDLFHVFQVSRAFIDALKTGTFLHDRPSGAEAVSASLAGINAALPHAYGNCNPPAEF